MQHSKRSCAGKAIILTGQNAPTDTEVQLYHRVLQQQGYRVDQARYAETSASLRQDRRGERRERDQVKCIALWKVFFLLFF